MIDCRTADYAAAVTEQVHWRLFRLTSAYRRREQEQIAMGGLTLTQCSMLYILREHGPKRIGELAEIDGVTAPTTTQAVARLEKLGLVRRTRDDIDHRIVRVELTAQGRAVHRDSAAQLLAAVLDELDPEEIEALHSALAPLERLTSAVRPASNFAVGPATRNTL